MSRKISCFNRANVCGYVQSFDIRSLSSGTRLANMAIKDELTNNITYVSMFDRDTIMFGDTATTLDGLEKIFMTNNAGKKTSRHVLVTCSGKVRETTSVSGGATKTYVNTTVFNIEPCADASKQSATLSITGVIDAIKYFEDEHGNPAAKLKIGAMTYNRDKDITGVDYISLVAYGDVASKLEELDAEKNSVISVRADMLNTLGEVDRFGDRVGAPRKEMVIAKVVFVNTEDEVDEDDLNNYRKAKNLNKGEVVKVAKDTAPKLADDIDDDDIDF